MTSEEIKSQIDKYEYHETSFKYLMQNRIYKVLIICSNYDFFMLEEDGRVDEQIFNEYVALNLRYPPIFIQADSSEKAMAILAGDDIDLIITMLNIGDEDVFEFSKIIKDNRPEIPIVVLTPFSREVRMRVMREDLRAIDYVFSWLGHTDILLAIIKLIEDKMNIEHDVLEENVQCILLVEDNIRFYSSYLPNMYKIIFQQSKEFMTEGMNEHKAMMRMRGRPKIILATNYQEAVAYYEKYKSHLLGIISDIRYPNNDVLDGEAGFKLARKVKGENPLFPFLLQSSESKNKKIAKDIKVGFINKRSSSLLPELRSFIKKYFAFGDFVFQDPDTGWEVARASDLVSLQKRIRDVSDNVLCYHVSRNHISKWLYARALFPLAELFSQVAPSDFVTLSEVRGFLDKEISQFRWFKGQGVISKFDREKYDEFQTFSRVGDGSLGGKARGLAFINSFLKRHDLYDKFPGVTIKIPRTIVLSTDVFDEFMEDNNLYETALSDLSDSEILEKFVSVRLPERITEDLKTFIKVVKTPIAIRSSSVLEDSHYQPFAGIYSTYMIPKIDSDPKLMLRMLATAIKSVYASVFFRASKAYMLATQNVIDEEKMGIILQEVTGKRYANRFYPTISGVARSINFYPIEPEKSKDGIANIALGLGRIIVDGGVTLRFSPKYPKKVLQLSSPSMALRGTQKEFYALDLMADSFKPSVNEDVNIMKLRLKDAEKDKSLRFVASTYDYHNDIIRNGVRYDGKRIITFANILSHDTFPLPEILQMLLEIGQSEMNNPIEIEFAVNLDVPKGEPAQFSFLQIRPIVENTELVDVDINKIAQEETIIQCSSALGNGIVKDIYDFVYVKPETFNAADSHEIALEVEKVNLKFVEKGENYILVGPGRWGSSDSWLGIPVKWSQISAARLIVESGLENFRIDPSQGTHFFQNLTAFRVGYFTINPFSNDGFYDLDYLSKFEPVFENKYIRHIRFEKPCEIRINGAENLGVVMKPES